MKGEGTMSEEKNKNVAEEVKEEIKESPEPKEENVSDEELDATAGGSSLCGKTDKNRIDD
jgi:hypothetical protein